MILFMLLIIGLCIGSFLNVLIDRLPKEENVLWGHSHCDFCKKQLRWFELIPLFSFLVQGGRCRRCKKKLSWQYPLVELVTGLLFVFVPYQWLLVICCLLVIFVADCKFQIIPDQMLVIIALALLWQQQSLANIWAAIGGFLFFWLLWFVTRGKGMGFGDVKLAGLIGYALGYPMVIVSFYVAFLTGATYGVILMLAGHAGMKSKIPFGPFLLVSSLSAFFLGDPIIAWWHRLFI